MQKALAVLSSEKSQIESVILNLRVIYLACNAKITLTFCLTSLFLAVMTRWLLVCLLLFIKKATCVPDDISVMGIIQYRPKTLPYMDPLSNHEFYRNPKR